MTGQTFHFFWSKLLFTQFKQIHSDALAFLNLDLQRQERDSDLLELTAHP